MCLDIDGSVVYNILSTKFSVIMKIMRKCCRRSFWLGHSVQWWSYRDSFTYVHLQSKVARWLRIVSVYTNCDLKWCEFVVTLQVTSLYTISNISHLTGPIVVTDGNTRAICGKTNAVSSAVNRSHRGHKGHMDASCSVDPARNSSRTYPITRLG